VSDWLGAGNTVADLEKRAESARPRFRSPLAAPKTGLDVVCMADVRPTAIEYLWPNWIALGKVHVLAGEGGRGKTTLLHDWTSRTTTGDRWPDGAEGSSPGSVLILASEDDVGDTIAPRLIAAGADMSRVFVIRSVRDVDQRRRGFNLQADLEMLGAEIDRRSDVRLVIFDPVTSYLGKVDLHNRRQISALSRLPINSKGLFARASPDKSLSLSKRGLGGLFHGTAPINGQDLHRNGHSGNVKYGASLTSLEDIAPVRAG